MILRVVTSAEPAPLVGAKSLGRSEMSATIIKDSRARHMVAAIILLDEHLALLALLHIS